MKGLQEFGALIVEANFLWHFPAASVAVVRRAISCSSCGAVCVFRCCVSRAVSCESYHGIISQCRVADRVAVSLRCQ